MRQTEWLSEFSSLSEYTRLYPNRTPDCVAELPTKSIISSIASKFLTLCILMDFPIHIDTICMELPVVYFKVWKV